MGPEVSSFPERFHLIMFPVIPIIAWAVVALGGSALCWYHRLPQKEKEEADRLAAGYSSELFDKAVNQLTADEARQISKLVRRHFDN
jgi:hypothetical protein